MLADECAPSHAESLTQSLRYALTYADELRAMLADGRPDPEKAAHLVQAIRNMLCASEDELDPLDDVQQEIDAVAAIHGLSDVELFSAITDTPTSGNP
ncbi:hypothetical protein AMK26_24455 [Streptomyces sp. CB03234]|uniref:hypothetical protein n=1 Tax=Streptomyces sp. (strain CB03234) TaxID=1703937 RepID=UPI000939C7D3|nr:hypothetical protein [Streptomyces sp. CB03234]OKK02739.1 hypothetical protein AMK26_24455 [Streptomyces sp. CB03234]